MHDSEDFETFGEQPELAALGRFIRLVPGLPWFRHVGDPLDSRLRQDAANYSAALGFPEAEPAVLALWEDAVAACETLDYNAPAWEAEEQLRASLEASAGERHDEELLRLALTHLSAVAAEAAEAGARDIAGFLEIRDPDFVRLATASAVQACHQAALLLAAGEEADHPFSFKFRIFEHGRWPLSICGTSLNIF